MKTDKSDLKKNYLNQKSIPNKNKLISNTNYHPSNLLLNKNKFEGQKKIINKKLINSELIKELQYIENNKKEECSTNQNNSENLENIISSSRIKTNRDNNYLYDDKNQQKNVFANLINKENDLKNNVIHYKSLNDQKADLQYRNLNFKNEDAHLSKNANENVRNQNKNIIILENDSDIILNDTSKYNKLNNTDINARNSNADSKSLQDFVSEASYSKVTVNKNNFENNISNFSNKDKDLKENNFKEDSIQKSKASIDKNKSFYNISQYADDMEDMNTIIKKLNFAKNSKNEDSIFNLNSRIYIEFDLKFKNEIEAYLFPQK